MAGGDAATTKRIYINELHCDEYIQKPHNISAVVSPEVRVHCSHKRRHGTHTHADTQESDRSIRNGHSDTGNDGDQKYE